MGVLKGLQRRGFDEPGLPLAHSPSRPPHQTGNFFGPVPGVDQQDYSGPLDHQVDGPAPPDEFLQLTKEVTVDVWRTWRGAARHTLTIRAALPLFPKPGSDFGFVVLGGAIGADHLCQSEFGANFKALIVGGGRRATITPLKGDGQLDWVIQKYMHYYNEEGQLLWRTDNLPLLGVSNGQRLNVYAPAFSNLQIYPWGGYDSGWVEVPKNDTIGEETGTCLGWSTSDGIEEGTFPLPDLTIGRTEPCSRSAPLLCVEQ